MAADKRYCFLAGVSLSAWDESASERYAYVSCDAELWCTGRNIEARQATANTFSNKLSGVLRGISRRWDDTARDGRAAQCSRDRRAQRWQLVAGPVQRVAIRLAAHAK